MSQRSRAWSLTIFDEEELKKFIDLAARYKCYGKEICPSTKKVHWQSYIYFTNAKTFSSMKKKLLTSHIEISRGSPLENKNYCSKDGDFIEIGDLPIGGKISAEELKNMSNLEIIERDARCHNAYIKARDLLNADIDIDDIAKAIVVYWIQGPSGCGKTQKAKEIIRLQAAELGTKINLIKYVNNFYMGIGSAKIALYDDFRDSHMRPAEFINLIDYNKQLMNIKNGQKINDYELIIITSVQNINDIYKNVKDEPRKQWIRRIVVIDMFPIGNPRAENDIELDNMN